MIKIILISILIFVSSCDNGDKVDNVGKKIVFVKDELNVDKDSFQEGLKLSSPNKNDLWIQKGGNDSHSLSNVIFKLPFNKKWTFDTNQEISEDHPFLTQPVGKEKKLYILNNDGIIFCLNKENGSLIWEKKFFQETDNTLLGPGSIVIDKLRDSIIVHNGKNKIIAINLKSKKIKWVLNNKLPFRGSLSLKKNNLLINDYEGNLFNINPINGKIIWKKKLSSSAISIYTNARPIVFDNLILNPGSNGIFYVLNLKNGRLIFSDYLPRKKSNHSMFKNNDIIANPIYYDGIIYLISHSGTLAAYKKNTFENLWNVSIGSSNTPVVSGKTIFTFDNLGHVYAIDTKTGKIRWKQKFDLFRTTGYFFEETNKINYYGPYIVDGKVLIFNNKEELFFLNPENGKIEKTISFENLGTAPLFFTNKITLLFSNGKISQYN